MTSQHGTITRSATGPAFAETFVIIAIATILITRLYLQLTGYPQIGGGDLHIAHALYGGALMMLALLLGWMMLGLGVRAVCIVLGGIGFGLFLDEVGKFVTKDNDYFYGPAAEIMYVLVVIILVGARVLRDFRPLSAQECLASAASIAADGVARGLPERRRELGLSLVDRARSGDVVYGDADHVQALLISAHPASDRVYAARRRALRLIPGLFRSPRWIPVVGWMLVIGSFLGASLDTLGVALGGYFYEDDHLKLELGGLGIAVAIQLVTAVLTLGIALPAMIAHHRRGGAEPVRWLRIAALIFTLLNALVDFATEGFGALITLSIGLFALAILSYQLDSSVQSGTDADGLTDSTTVDRQPA
jgi:hypothetical protein